MKGETTLKILECIGNVAIDVTDLTLAFLTAGYGSSANKILREFDKKGAERSRKKAIQSEEQQRKRRFDKFLYRLKADELIEEKISDDKSYIKLTPKGKQRFEILKKRRVNALPSRAYHVGDQKGNKFVIVVFDIPERERRKRAWLRSALKNIGFQLIQKSVWAGKVKIPKEFLDDIKELRLIEFVEIFEISKTGSLRQLV